MCVSVSSRYLFLLISLSSQDTRSSSRALRWCAIESSTNTTNTTPQEIQTLVPPSGSTWKVEEEQIKSICVSVRMADYFLRGTPTGVPPDRFGVNVHTRGKRRACSDRLTLESPAFASSPATRPIAPLPLVRVSLYSFRVDRRSLIVSNRH